MGDKSLKTRHNRFCVFAFVFLVFSFLILTAPAVLAQESALPAAGQAGIADAADMPAQAGVALSSTDPRIIVAKIIRVALGFLGIIVLVLILYGGFLWMTSAGNEEQIDKAKKFLINAVIGLAIILSALAIVQFVIRALTRSTGAPPLPPPQAAAARVGGGALGSGIIESHFPFRGESNIARNTRIIITFKDTVNPTSLAEIIPNTVTDDTEVYTQNADGVYVYPKHEVAGRQISALRLKRKENGDLSAIQIIQTADIKDSVRESDEDKYLGSAESGVDVLVDFTEDMRTFVFTPVDPANRSSRKLFGSPAEDVSYTVYLCGTASSPDNCQDGGIQLLNGLPAFQGHFRDYQWSFETGTFIDTIPPRVFSILPIADRGLDAEGSCPNGLWRAAQGICDRVDKARNAMLQVNFSEAVLPTVASGKTLTLSNGVAADQGEIKPGTYDEMRVYTQGPVYLAGQWHLANQYRTAEFVSDDLCGRNACGQDVFCLPAQERITTDIFAATLLAPGEPTSKGLFDGIEDVAGNSLDGNSNRIAQGPSAFFDWNQHQKNTEDTPGDNERWSFYTSVNIDLTGPVIELIDPTIEQAGVLLTPPVETTFNELMAMSTFGSDNIIISGEELATGAFWDAWWTLEGQNRDSDDDGEVDKTLARILHGPFWEDSDYDMNVSSRVKDLFQNCYLPSAGVGCGTESLSPFCPYCCNGQPSSTDCTNPPPHTCN